ncbi:MAG TPA: aspartate aminotransferase family protein [Cytophagaceae bacterium]|jgi:putrescine aminotransferase|nr:aspartate aminotransferase family protein [Cytophagaceae bacterium]
MITHRQLFLSRLAQTSPAPLMLEIERAEGVYMYGTDGKRYMDLISGIAVSNLGHCHPKVVQAVKDQADKYMHLMVYGEFVQSPQVKLAEKICSTLPENLNNIYFVNSGSEAVEGSLKLAKRFTGKTEIIYFSDAYHGSTHGALSLNGNEYFKRQFRPLLPETRKLRFNNIDDLRQISSQTAAVIIEPIQGEAGVNIPDEKFMKALAATCKEQRVLLIADEIQTGFGRTGKFWAFEHFNIQPDIILCAKGMGGGMPIGAFISSKEIMSSLADNPILGHITTFGGHPVCCAASLATIEAIEEEKLIEKVPAKEKLFKELLVHPSIKSIRSKGLMMAIEFDSFETVKEIISNGLENGILTDWFLHCNNSIRIAPPLIITETQIKEACEKLLNSIPLSKKD